MKILEALLDLLFPPKCPFCGRVQDEAGICRDCRRALPLTEGSDSLRELPSGLLCAAPLWYRDCARAGILRFKFQGALSAAAPLGQLIAKSAAAAYPEGFDVVTWAPVSPRRLRERGYDQARLLAEEACKVWQTRPVGLLRKVRNNAAQSGMENAAARRRNVRGVYRALPAAAGKRVLLIDDICTTGSTLSACAEVLLAAGASSVLCAAAARTPKDVDSREKRKESSCNPRPGPV